jgi:hypothetical protein
VLNLGDGERATDSLSVVMVDISVVMVDISVPLPAEFLKAGLGVRVAQVCRL